ncbi:unnamed protein product [Microthlaspi erraticum]|uniref:Uncharacterized protein n=1 Tax=Microthlaspi erraticum TaxID=1685480 RepID=A0A6D2JWU5_9BRAS|nr:unnamed protein product [Microthlaspi erraticum]
MKEEPVSGLIGCGELSGGRSGSVWQSPVKRMTLDDACGDRSRTSCKRIKTTQVNGCIVYTRTKKTKFTKLNEGDENAGFSETRFSDRPTIGVTVSQFVSFYQRTKRSRWRRQQAGAQPKREERNSPTKYLVDLKRE